MLGVLFAIARPGSGDLAGALHRTQLVATHGPLLWDGQWYGGHPTLGYSAVYPLLAAAVGVQVLGALCAVAASLAFLVLLDDARRGVRPLATAWFALGAGAWLYSGRMAFELGLVFGVASMALLRRVDRAAPALPVWAASAAAGAAALASPVAGAFTALGALATAVADRRRRKAGAAAATAALLTVVALSVAFGDSGTEPFAPSSFWPALAGTLGLALIARHVRGAGPLQVGLPAYAVALTAAFVIPTPVGGNAARLGALAAGPVAVVLLAPRWRALALLAVPLAYWQLVAPIRDLRTATGDRSTGASYYTPLLRFLDREAAAPGGGAPFRVEVPITREKYESYYLAARYFSPRGWERQLDRARNPLFYGTHLDAGSYRAFLDANAVRYVAVPDAPLDGPGEPERRLIARGLPYLRAVFLSAHWRLYEVDRFQPFVQAPGRLVAVANDRFTLFAARSGSFRIAARYSPYWAVTEGRGCVSRSRDGFTTVTVTQPGPLTLAIRFLADRVFDASPRCSSR